MRRSAFTESLDGWRTTRCNVVASVPPTVLTPARAAKPWNAPPS